MAEKLNVVFYEPSGRGGICHYTYQLAGALISRGCGVTLATPEKYELAQMPRQFGLLALFRASRVKRLLSAVFPSAQAVGVGEGRARAASGGRNTTLGSFLRWWRLRLIFAGLVLRLLWRGPDVVHIQAVKGGRDLVLVRMLRSLGFRMVYTAHDLLPHDSESAADERTLAETCQAVDLVIVHADRNREELISRFHVEPTKIECIPHGSYDFFFPEPRIARGEARERLGFPAGDRIALFFGLIKPYKGLEYLVEAFSQIGSRIPNARLVIAGALFQDPGGFYRNLLEKASRRGNVTCVIDYVPFECVGLYFSASDVIVLPYTKTYQSGVLMAAYAAGRPVVVTDTGGLSEVVEEGKTGFVVPPRDSAPLATAIGRILADPAGAEVMGRRARDLSRTTYSWDRIAGQTIGLYRSLSARHAVDAGARQGEEMRIGEPGAPAVRRGRSA